MHSTHGVYVGIDRPVPDGPLLCFQCVCIVIPLLQLMSNAPSDLHTPQKQSAVPVSAAPVTGEFKPATPLSVMMAPGATASPAGQHEAGRGGSAGVWLLRVSDRAAEAARCGGGVVSELVYKRGPVQVQRRALITLASIRGVCVLWLAAIWKVAMLLMDP